MVFYRITLPGALKNLTLNQASELRQPGKILRWLQDIQGRILARWSFGPGAANYAGDGPSRDVPEREQLRDETGGELKKSALPSTLKEAFPDGGFGLHEYEDQLAFVVLLLSDNFVGTELDLDVQYAKIAEACGLKGVQVITQQDLTDALATAVKEQMEDGVTTFIEVVLNQELGEPFRRDAMKAPVPEAGIDLGDMQSQAAE